MREILFKGKRKDNGEWVEGDLFHNDNTNYPMTLIGGLILSRNKYTDEIDIDGYGLIEVDHETVCQYTNKDDVNFSKIWEHDIVKISFTNEENGKIYSFNGEVIFKNNTYGVWFCLKKKVPPIFADINTIWFETIEVIGTVFDNPELLEVTE